MWFSILLKLYFIDLWETAFTLSCESEQIIWDEDFENASTRVAWWEGFEKHGYGLPCSRCVFWRFKWRRGLSHSSQKQEKHFTFSLAPSLDRYPIQWKHSATQDGQTLACLSGRYGIPWNGVLWRALEQLQLCPIRPKPFLMNYSLKEGEV